MMRTKICFWAVFFFWPVLLRAADPQVEKAIAAYDDFEYQQAINILQQVLKKPLGQHDREMALIYLGLCYFTIGNQKQAEEAFRKVIEENYDAQLPQYTSPKIVEFFEKLKSSIPWQQKVVATQPPEGGMGGAMVEVEKKLPPPPSPKRLWTWVALGAGGTLVAGGVVFAYLASAAKSDFDKEPWADRAADLKSTVESRALTANVLLGAGAAAVVAGFVLFFVEGKTAAGASGNRPLSIYFGPAGIDFTVRF